MTRRISWYSGALCAVVFVLLGIAAWWLLRTTLMAHDDEGYVLYSLQTYATHGHLYDQVYTQYGPFFYSLFRVLHAVGLAFTSTTGREMAWCYWLGCVAFCGAMVWRETRGQGVATLAAMVGVFNHLYAMTAEPSHPGGLIALLTAFAAWAGTHPTWSPRTRGAALGAIAGMLLLTKINVGVFFIGAVGGWYLFQLPTRQPAWWRSAVALALASMPLLLMGKGVAEPWLRTFVVVVACGTITVLFALSRRPTVPVVAREIGYAIGGAIVLGLGTIALTLATGSTVRGLADGIILGPMRLPSVYSFAFPWRAGSTLCAIGGLAGAFWLSRQRSEVQAAVIAPARIALAVAYAVCSTGYLVVTDAPTFALSFGVATAWVFVWPVSESDTTFRTRAWLALLLVLQSLHAFPVPGSQVAWGTFVWVPLATLGVVDAAMIIQTRALARVLGLGFAGVAAFLTAVYVSVGFGRVTTWDNLDLTGAEQLRPPPIHASALRMLVRNAQVHGDMLFSMPGLLSLNLWSGLPAPTLANTTQWFTLLSAEQQAEIQRRLEADPRSVVVMQRYILDMLIAERHVIDTPLTRWLNANYHRAFKVETYEFWVRNPRRIVPVCSARLFTSTTERPTRYRVDVVLAPAGTAHIEAFAMDETEGARSTPRGQWTNDNARFVVTKIDSAGQPQGTPQIMRLPLTVSGVSRIEIFTNAFPSDANLRHSSVRAYTPNGTFEEAHFID